MARTPKPARGKLTAADIKATFAAATETPSPARRGRKSQSAENPAETPAEPLAVTTSDDAATGASDADASIAAPSEKPARGRPGSKPKPQDVEAAIAAPQVKRKPGRPPRNSVPAPEPEPVEDMPPSAELTPSADAPSENAEAPSDTMPATASTGDAEPLPASRGSTRPDSTSQGPASPVKPAAQWDRATDTVQFDWAAVEQTASQDGPNQVMAKLLIAARAEGANSRWPL